MECKLSRIITHWSIPSILLKDQKRLTISITQPGQCQTSKDCQKLMRRNNRIIMIHPYIYIQIQSSIRFSSNRIQKDGITSKRWTAGPCFEESPKPPCSYATKTSKTKAEPNHKLESNTSKNQGGLWHLWQPFPGFKWSASCLPWAACSFHRTKNQQGDKQPTIGFKEVSHVELGKPGVYWFGDLFRWFRFHTNSCGSTICDLSP